jgi:hypothetical protein
VRNGYRAGGEELRLDPHDKRVVLLGLERELARWRAHARGVPRRPACGHAKYIDEEFGERTVVSLDRETVNLPAPQLDAIRERDRIGGEARIAAIGNRDRSRCLERALARGDPCRA